MDILSEHEEAPQRSSEPSFESSRVIVKNLPKRITSERVRSHFGAKGAVTDVKLATTPYDRFFFAQIFTVSHSDGRFRGFAFVGFSSSKEARDTVKYFNSTFMDTSRIQVELAKARGDPTLERPWSKYSQGSSGFSSRNPNATVAASAAQKAASAQEAERERVKAELEKKRKFLMSIYGDENGKVDPEMQRFVSAMKSKGKTKTWENDDDAFEGPAEASKKRKKKKGKEAKVQIDVSAVPSRKAGAHGALVEQVHLKFEESSASEEDEGQYEKAFGASESDDDLYDELPVKEDVGDSEHDSSCNEQVSDAESAPLVQKEDSPSTTPPNTTAPTEQTEEDLSPDMIAENGRLFVRNLSYACTEDDLRALFEPFGPLTEVHMPIERETKRPKGFAYILFMLPEHALKAYGKLDGTIFQGRILHVLPGRDKPVKQEEQRGDQKSAFKNKQEQERKAQSDKDYNWNSLFIRSDTILDAIAVQLGVPKSEIMDARSSDNLATRLAVAETHLIQETKQYLESQGVILDAFSGKLTTRSTTLLLAKNLPFDTEAKELRNMFSKYGSLGRVVLPPVTKAIALIEFLEASEARAAFRGLAYSRFHGVPLYLEWAPVTALKPAEAAASEDEGVEEKEEEVVRVRAVNSADLKEQPSEEAAVGAPTLYVSNINWSTPADSLKQIFSTVGPVQSVRLATKKDPKTGQTLSLGFGFVEFSRRESLNRALDTLQGTVLDGHALVLKRSTATSQATSGKKSKKSEEPAEVSSKATKLIIRNVPFEATDRDLKELFHSFAQLKRVRLPRRFNGQHRGFAFADFLTHSEAANALNTLAHTHLYGRHLVLEWAKEASVEDEEERHALVEEEARRKAGKRATSASAPGSSSKKSKTSRVTIREEDPLDYIPEDD